MATWLCGYVTTPKDTKRTLKDTKEHYKTFTEGYYSDTEEHYFDIKDTILRVPEPGSAAGEGVRGWRVEQVWEALSWP